MTVGCETDTLSMFVEILTLSFILSHLSAIDTDIGAVDLRHLTNATLSREGIRKPS